MDTKTFLRVLTVSLTFNSKSLTIKVCGNLCSIIIIIDFIGLSQDSLLIPIMLPF